MPHEGPQTPASSDRSNRTARSPALMLYAAAVLLDFAIAWYRTTQHFAPPILVFRCIESAIKLTVMALVLRGRRWASAMQIVLSAVALASGMALTRQANSRAASDPLVWVSLVAQVLAGAICVVGILAWTRPRPEA